MTFEEGGSDLAERAAGEFNSVRAELDPLRWDSTKLRAAKAALAKIETTPMDILLLSDSWGAGSGAGSPIYGKRWWEKFQDRLRDIVHPPRVYGGIGYRESWTNTPSGVLPFTYTGTTTTSSAVGLGRKTVRLSLNATVAFVVPGTSVDILYGKGGLASTFTWKINSGSETSVDAANGGVVAPGVLRIGTGGVGTLAPGDTITLKATANYMYFEGVQFYDQDEAAGIRFWNASTSSYRAFDFVDGTEASYGSWATVNPDLVIIDLGANEFTGGAVGTANVRTPAQMKASLVTVLAEIKERCTVEPSVIQLIKPTLPLPGGVTNPDPFSAYRAAMFDFAREDGKMAVRDLEEIFGTAFTGTDTYGLTAGDSYHPGPHGYTLIAELVTDLLAGMIGRRVNPRPRIVPDTTTIHSSQAAVMPDGARIIKHAP